MPFSIKPSAAFCLTLVFAAGQRVLAANDWSAPCTQGKCSWDLPPDSDASGTVNIWGPVNAISDITPASGWQITTGCDPSSFTQDIHVVCNNNNPNCDHLFQGSGAVNTIVRLPDNCGPMPFARVSQHQVLHSNLSSRADEAPVHQLALDTNFTAAGPSQDGAVYFSVQGWNTKGNSNTGQPAQRGYKRVRSPSSSQSDVHRRNLNMDKLNSRWGFGSFDDSISPKPIPIDRSIEANLFNTNLQCPVKAGKVPITASGTVSLDVDANVQASIGIGVVASGTMLPPKITDFGLDFVLGGSVDAKFKVEANIAGGISSPDITLFQVGIPGLSFPGILDLGPEFKVTSHVDATFELNDLNAVVEVNYDLGGASFVFPKQEGSNGAGITPSTKQVTITPGPLSDVGAKFEATAHLVPQIDVGLSALHGIVSSSVFLNLDASADFTATITDIENPHPCVTASSDINVGVGAEASFFDLFDKSAGKSLFDKQFTLFQKCFPGNPNATNSSSSQVSSTASTTATSSASHTSASGTNVTSSASRTSAPSVTATSLSSRTSVSGATVTDSASHTSASGRTTTDSVSHTSVSSGRATTDSASHTSASSGTAVTDSASHTTVPDRGAITSASHTSAPVTTATDSASQTSKSSSSATSKTSQTSASDTKVSTSTRSSPPHTTATHNPKIHHGGIRRVVRHHARLGRSSFPHAKRLDLSCP